MKDSDGFGPLSEKKLTEKELEIFTKVINLMFESREDLDEEDRAELNNIMLEKIENTIYNATKIKEILENN